MPTLREQAEVGALRVRDEYARTGTLPAGLIRQMQAHAVRHGRVLTYDQVEREAREWFERVLAAVDAGADPEEVK